MPSHFATAPTTPVRDRASHSKRPSPRTPSTSAHTTPYTSSPFSGRSFSSTFTSPASKYSPRSPFHAKSAKSLADLTDNWRERAQLNGIRVTVLENGEYSKEASLHHNTSNIRQKSLPLTSPVSSLRRSRPKFSTPSPKTHRLQSLGCLTAPAEPRRRLFESPFLDTTPHDDHVDAPPSDSSPGQNFQGLFKFNKSDSLYLHDPNSACSVCDKEPSNTCRMIVLSPCSHIFCSSCFTGTLNIVGEKNLSCMDCNSPVDSFHFALGDLNATSSDVLSKMTTVLRNGLSEPLTPGKPSISASVHDTRRDGIAVLRIDNVPWDVTPFVIEQFINRPIIEAHVLLDPKGKTLSHAFVQLLHEDARIALRSSQNAILGRGRRARAVTVTLSSQEELMVALYPHWRGRFQGGAPCLDGLDNEQVNEALEHGLLSDVELKSLLNLITTPNSHFLKVPSLPFYSLISILSTFPSDLDSRIFWSPELRDSLFYVTIAAFQTLASRQDEFERHDELCEKLRTVSLNCRAFTDSQIFKLKNCTGANDMADTSDQEPPLNVPELSELHLDIPQNFEQLAAQLGLQPKTLAALLQLQSSRAFL
ncbi:hypothetical protein JB92DRAFT_1456782 [Gautieria morchelliformis]|nr:hypothetical protein JB92DRAFT_1456782 [Gautieria morchelliformis]